MKTVLYKALCLLLGAGLWAGTVHANNTLLMVRSAQSFPETMSLLQEIIKAHGYTVSRVQRVDIGLTASGYKTDKYRVVFFGKPDEINSLSEKFPHIIPYLPLKIAIFAEQQETLLVTSSPLLLKQANQAKLNEVLQRWDKDIQSMFLEISNE